MRIHEDTRRKHEERQEWVKVKVSYTAALSNTGPAQGNGVKGNGVKRYDYDHDRGARLSLNSFVLLRVSSWIIPRRAAQPV
jgi:hypothetical protein